MAVIPRVPGISVEVKIAGEKTVEYPDTQWRDDSLASCPQHSCYIESRSAAPFSIHFKATNESQLRARGSVVIFHVYIDGCYITGNFHSIPGEIESPQESCVSVFKSRCPKTGQLVEQDLLFAHIESVETDDNVRITEDKKVAEKLGLIEVKVYAAKVGLPSNTHRPPRDSRGNFSLAEKSMKGKSLSHGTSFGPTRTATQTTFKMKEMVSVCRFKFHYRSLDSLHQELIIPSGTASHDQTVEAVDEDPVVMSIAKTEHGGRIKCEHGHDGENVPSGDSRQNKKPKQESSMEVIDLTQD